MNEQLTYLEIAERYRRSRSYVVNKWAVHPAWPGPVGKRGRALVFDAGQVAAFVAAHGLPPVPSLGGKDDDELIDVGEMAELTGYAGKSLWSMVGHGRWPRPVGKRRKRDADGQPTEQLVALWRVGDVRAELAGRKMRPGRRAPRK